MTKVASLAAGESLATGAEGEQVEELQRRLTHLGYYHGEVDGRYHDATVAAVRAYQSATGHTDDGTTGPELWEKLERDAHGAGYGKAQETAKGQLSEDGQWQWNGTQWVAAAAARQATAAQHVKTGQLSEDGNWQWNGTDWVAAKTAATTTEAKTTSAAGQLSEDGKWRWTGTEWVAATANKAAATGTATTGTVTPAAGQVAGQPTGRAGGTAATPATGGAASQATGAATGQATGQAAGATGAGGAANPGGAGGEPKKWARQINDGIDDGTTEAAEAPTLGGVGKGDDRG